MKTKRVLVDVEYNPDVYDEEELFRLGSELFYDSHISGRVVNLEGDVELTRREKNILLHSIEILLEKEPRWQKDEEFKSLRTRLSVGAGGPI